MSNIEILDTGLMYRNPKPHLHAIHALFPSVVCTETGEMLAAFLQAEAFEAGIDRLKIRWQYFSGGLDFAGQL